MYESLPQDVELTLPAVTDSLAIASRALDDFARPLTLGDEGLFPLDLALSEAMTNVIKHGYHYDASRTLRLSLRYREEERVLEIGLVDSGTPIPAALLQQEKHLAIDPDDMESWPENGMGIMFIQASVDEVRYQSDHGENTLTLCKRLA
ncbi:ATP-binding protein [Nissabacter sp. SGAir0207]|uniref:ATP-binding protein n=1 Tax=Nissabacter sp. SGAir0207 TaxID=2126321 RepID=UPI0010CD251C|nr:ATP-binding protein [Nissabacter sp. SGAir0207]QCR38547.1 ATP-binding protein [Nissabacter sp. SGAir0207]